MTQLIIDSVQLPESQKGGYTVTKEPLSRNVEMISGRMVRELRGNIWQISYQYGYFSDELKNQVLAACEKGKMQPITCGFLPQESAEELSYSDFFVTSVTRPKFMWSSNDKPMWGDFAVELREVRPHD